MKTLAETRARGALRLLLGTIALVSLALAAPWGGFAHAATCDTSWASAVSGTWSDATKWTAGVPSAAAKVCITVAGTYTVTGGGSAKGLTLGGSSGTQTLDLNGSTLALNTQGSGSNGIGSHGVVLLRSDTGSYSWLNITGGTLTNAGSIQSNTSNYSAALNYLDGTVVNNGTVAVNFSMTNENRGSWTNAGKLTVGSGATFFHGSGDFTWNSGTITNSGALQQLGGGTFFANNAGALGGNAIAIQNASVAPSGTGSAAFTVTGSSRLSSDIAAGYALNVDGGTLAVDASRTNNGTLTFGSDTGAYAWLNVENGATLTNAGTIQSNSSNYGAAVNYWYGDVVNIGTIAINFNTTNDAKGSWTSKGLLTVASGATLNLNTKNLTLTGGTLGGSGTVQAATVTNTSGNVAPGASPGTLTITGGYTQSSKGKLTVEIAGNGAGQYDVLAVTGAATLGGTLVLAPSFTATLGQTFGIVTAGSLTGKFKKVSKASIKSGLYYAPTYTGTGSSLVVKQATVSVPGTAMHGATIGVSGTGWLPGDKVTLTFTDSASAKTIYPTVTANGSGSFSTTITIPAAAALGTGKVNAKSTITSVSLTKNVSVT